MNKFFFALAVQILGGLACLLLGTWLLRALGM